MLRIAKSIGGWWLPTIGLNLFWTFNQRQKDPMDVHVCQKCVDVTVLMYGVPVYIPQYGQTGTCLDVTVHTLSGCNSMDV